MYYGPILMHAAGFSHQADAMSATFVLGLTNLIATIVTVVLIDYLGRRLFLWLGSLIACISLLALVLLSHYVAPLLFPYIALGCLICFMVGYCISFGSLFWLIISEIFPLASRGCCMSIVTGVQWLANFVVASSFLTVLHMIGLMPTLTVCAVIALLAIIFVMCYVPETQGVPLELIEQRLHSGVPLKELGQVSVKGSVG